MDLLSANAPTTPQHDITPDQLRALLLGEPDRFEHLRNATWDPATAVAQQPAWSSSPSETENPVPTLPDALPRTESRWNEAPSTMQTVNSGSFASPTSSFDFPISGSRPTVPVDLPGDARFRDTSEVDVAEVPKPKRTSKLKKAFEKQDGPPPPIADSLGDRSTKLLRIVAAGLLGLGLLLVGYIQFRDTDGQTPVNSIESVVVPNADPTIAAPLDVPIPSVQVVSTAPASIATSETTVALAGETETPSTAVTETTIAETTTPDTAPTDDFFAEGEDFSFSEPEDFSVK